MHMCFLGVMRCLLPIWVRGKNETRISAAQTALISKRLLGIRHCIPDCFARKPRGLDEINRWKAIVFREG